MQLTCPCCRARFPFEAVLQDEMARRAVMAALKLPAPLGERLLTYLGFFRPAKHTLSWTRVTTLLNELQTMIDAGQIERNGRLWAAPQANWSAALDQMLARRAKLTLPLAGHGYLLEILAGLANKIEAVTEAKTEEAKRRRPEHQPMGNRQGQKSVADLVTPELRAKWDRELGIVSEDE